MVAIDYQRLRDELPRARLLFVAHRAEILEQSRVSFQHALRDATFGELWAGGERPSRFEHVFASIQSLSSTGLRHLDPTHFDVVIVDEFHHAAADTYRAVLEHVRPLELLGRTATPERSDGSSGIAELPTSPASYRHLVPEGRACREQMLRAPVTTDLAPVSGSRGRRLAPSSGARPARSTADLRSTHLRRASLEATPWRGRRNARRPGRPGSTLVLAAQTHEECKGQKHRQRLGPRRHSTFDQLDR